jgi:hypothetical protein
VAEDQWPALAMATTADDGTFVAGVSPNGQYDLTVIPAGGTAFPWLVRPDHIYLPHAPDDGSATSDVASAVTSPAVTLEPLVVPPPAVLELTLHDYTDTPLTQAVVQAYAFAGGAAVEIGEALTDNNGHFMMTLSTQFATN